LDDALKLLTSASPATSLPADWVTTTSPYGLMSPLGGTVDATWLEACSDGRNGTVGVGVGDAFDEDPVEPHALSSTMAPVPIPIDCHKRCLKLIIPDLPLVD
jgi:hypothetical protein